MRLLLFLLPAILCAQARAHPASADGREADALHSPEISGWVVEAGSGRPLPQAVVQATWVLRPTGRHAKAGVGLARTVTLQAHSIVAGRFLVTGWERYPAAEGWEPVPGKDPVVHIYSKGHRRLSMDNVVIGSGRKPIPMNEPGARFWRWAGEGKKHALEALPASETAMARELALWKRELEAGFARATGPDRRAMLLAREKLLVLFDEACGALRAPPKGLCYSPESEAGRHLATVKSERARHLVVKSGDGKVSSYAIQGPAGSGDSLSAPASPRGADSFTARGYKR